jgi:outer membrane protein insertion porin family
MSLTARPAALALALIVAAASVARADSGRSGHDPAAPGPSADAQPAGARRPIVGYRMRGQTKTRESIAEFLSRTRLGEHVGPADIPRIEQGFLSSELFERVTVALEDTADGYLVVATVKDKHSWIAGPTVFALPNRSSFGLGFAENNFRGRNQKVLLYGQYGDRDSYFYGVWMLPSLEGTPLTIRLDTYSARRYAPEYLNPPDDPTDDTIAREVVNIYYGGGVLVGWRKRWWLSSDLRLRWGHVHYPRTHLGGDPSRPVPAPQGGGWDVTAQGRLTIDARHYRFGVSWGPFLQVNLETTIPGLDQYDYSILWLRGVYNWKFFEEHQLEARTSMQFGRNLPFHEELTLGAASDLRGYAVERFRGDARVFFRGEYSVPITKWRSFAFRAVTFWDTGWIGWRWQRTDRDYLPTQAHGTGLWRNSVGAGVRLYVRAVVLPLLGFDVAYGIEARAPEVYFQLGITDF